MNDKEIMQVTGQSMHPYLTEGDFIIIEKNLDFKVGDIILFERDGRSYIHRFFSNDLYKGDNLKRFDQEYGHKLNPLGRVQARLIQDQVYPLKRNLMTFILTFMSQRNHASIPFFHRLFAGLTFLLGRLSRQGELTHE